MIDIERVYLPGGIVQYRLLAGMHTNIGSGVPRYDVVEFTADDLQGLSRDQAKRKIKDKIKLTIRQIFERLTFETLELLERNFAQTGDMSTRVVNRRPGMRYVGTPGTDVRASRDAMDLDRPGAVRGNELYGRPPWVNPADPPVFNAETLRNAMRALSELDQGNELRALPSVNPEVSRAISSMRNHMDKEEHPREIAERKALKLLEEKIGDKKYKMLMTVGHFDEKGKHGIYQFHLNSPHGVQYLQFIDAGGKKRPIIWDLCIQSSVHDMPKGDVILARFLEFKADEEKFRRTANWRNVRTSDEAHEPFESSG